jgi:hypothetical protein
VEINKKLYMNEASRTRHEGFAPLQASVLRLIDAIRDYIQAELRRG